MSQPDPIRPPDAGAAPASPAVPPPPADATAPPIGATGPAGPAPVALVFGILLVVVGAVILAGRVLDVTLGAHAWPLWIIVPGLAMLLGSFAIPPRGGLGLAIPGAILAMLGGVLWVQDAYGLYATWAYAWALIGPTAPGLGMLLYGVVRADRQLVADGVRLTLIGLGLFLGFGLFFEGVVGLSGHRIANLDEVLPYAAIGFGLLLVVLSFVGRGRRRNA
jgi:hypothetical protein